MGWSTLSNGELLDAAEREFDLLVTTDQALRTQQNLSKRKIAILVLPFARLAAAETERRNNRVTSINRALGRVCRN
jgi:hypothetical protein